MLIDPGKHLTRFPRAFYLVRSIDVNFAGCTSCVVAYVISYVMRGANDSSGAVFHFEKS